MELLLNFCNNCDLFNWKQPENLKTLRKCTRCYAVAYCGKECQEEHWHKVHKKHCKYLGGLKKAECSEHRKDTCKTCIASDSVGDLVFSHTNPNYVCIFEHLNWKVVPPTFPHPFPLNGHPEDRIEKMVNVAQKVLLKIKVTKNPVYLLQPQQVDKFEKNLWDLRFNMYFNRSHGRDQNCLIFMASMGRILELDSNPWQIIANKASCSLCTDLLATLALLIQLTRSTIHLRLENALKSPNSLPKDYRQMSKQDQFFEVADKIVGALEQKVVPFSDLAAIACGGKPEQNCSQCHKEIIVQGISIEDLTVRKLTALVVVSPVQNKRYHCESTECCDKERSRDSNKMARWLMAVWATSKRLYETRCDHCFVLAPLQEVHRSKCRTKNYCSQVCRDADDAVHKVCCNPDKGQRLIEERKVRIGGKDKVVAANAETDSFAELMRKENFNPVDCKRLVEIIENSKKEKDTGKLAKEKVSKIDEVD